MEIGQSRLKKKEKTGLFCALSNVYFLLFKEKEIKCCLGNCYHSQWLGESMWGGNNLCERGCHKLIIDNNILTFQQQIKKLPSYQQFFFQWENTKK